jgi:cell fate (sporulation/competence/biofilm development) regulator YlbF (YheA/YmcA/DUF963 family)
MAAEVHPVNDFCALPLRPRDSLVDDQAAGVARQLAEELRASPQCQAFFQAAHAVSTDPQVSRLVTAIRARHDSYGAAETGALQAELEDLPVMQAYAQATQQLHDLAAQVDQAIGQAAGLPFVANVRPDRHG